jgi:hypothetical protein
MNVKIEKYYPHLYEGHNTEQSYRYLGLLPILCFGWEFSKANAVLLSRFRYPGSGAMRLVPYHPLGEATYKFFYKTLPFYVAFDVIYRNLKYNKNKSNEYKLKYTMDLLLFHSVATYILPYLLIGRFTKSLPRITGLICRRRIPGQILMFMGYAGILGFVVKGSDIVTDYLLDKTFRKYCFDFKKEFTGFRKFENFEVSEKETEIMKTLNTAGSFENIFSVKKNSLDYAI